MKVAGGYVALVGLLLLSMSALGRGQEAPGAGAAPATQPARSGSQAKAARWGFAPYNALSGMTEEQKARISDIHRKANAERKAIDDKEEADVMAVLTDAQKAELEKMKADKKARASEKRRSAKEDKAKHGENDDGDKK